jgi:para-nitrobenzyl esterase
MFPWPQAGTLHGEEIQYVFGHAGPGWTDGDRAVAELVQSYWVNFARTGDPNAGGLPAWQPYRGDGPVLWFGSGTARPGEVPAADRLRALDAILGG